jgi:hypothetical protein
MRLKYLAVVLGMIEAKSCVSPDAECTCRETNADKMSRNTALKIDAVTVKNECEMDTLKANFDKANKDLQMTMIQTSVKLKAMGKKSQALCDKAFTKYIPFGLDDLLPDSWGCGLILNDTRAFENDSREKDTTGNRIPNVIMLGSTGAGKSYYGNGLLGAQNPCPPIHSTVAKNYFGCGHSSNSVTRNVKAQYGTYFDDMYSQYGVKPMDLNVYDTPGFYDTDPGQILQNKRLIAKQLDIEIDAFIYLLGTNPRIDSTTQAIFSTLHEWTLGQRLQ